jgi:hypothetical protein
MPLRGEQILLRGRVVLVDTTFEEYWCAQYMCPGTAVWCATCGGVCEDPRVVGSKWRCQGKKIPFRDTGPGPVWAIMCRFHATHTHCEMDDCYRIYQQYIYDTDWNDVRIMRRSARNASPLQNHAIRLLLTLFSPCRSVYRPRLFTSESTRGSESSMRSWKDDNGWSRQL